MRRFAAPLLAISIVLPAVLHAESTSPTPAAAPTPATAPTVTPTTASAPAPHTGPPPHFEMATLEHEFGKVKAGTPLTWTFEFKNKGKSDLAIESLAPSCGCTKGEYDKLVKPGKSGKITLTIKNTEKYSGKIVKTAKVTTNDPEHATFNLTLRADFLGADPAAPATQ